MRTLIKAFVILTLAEIAGNIIIDVADSISKAASDYAKYKYGNKKQTA